MGLDLSQRNVDGVCLIEVTGEVDLNTSPELRRSVLDAIEQGNDVGIDLSAARYMDSSGVATLVEGLKSGKSSGASLFLISPSQAVLKVLQLARLDSLFEIRDSLAEDTE